MSSEVSGGLFSLTELGMYMLSSCRAKVHSSTRHCNDREDNTGKPNGQVQCDPNTVQSKVEKPRETLAMYFFCLICQSVKLNVRVKLIETPTPGPSQLHVKLASFVEFLGCNSTKDAQHDQQDGKREGLVGQAVLG